MAAAAMTDVLPGGCDDNKDEHDEIPVVNTFQKIESSVTILQQINSANVSLSNLFLRPLYKGTALERTAGGIGGSQSDTDDSILRKNIYFLAHHLENSNVFIIQLVQRGLLSLDERDRIMRHGEEHLKAVATFVYLIRKDSKLFSKLLDILRATQNSKIASILDHTDIDDGGIKIDISTQGAAAALPDYQNGQSQNPFLLPFMSDEANGMTIQDPSSLSDAKKWECKNCTFINTISISGNICEICSKTKDFEELMSNFSLECPNCTFINPTGQTTCEICGFCISSEVQEKEEGVENCDYYEDCDD